MSRLGPFIISSDDTVTPAVATSTSILSTAQGGFGQDVSAVSGFVSFTNGTPSFLADLVDVAGWATAGTGASGDPWTGWDTEITWSGGRLYWFRPGHFSFTSKILAAANDTHVQGAGNALTVLHFEPTAADTAFEFHNGAAMCVRSSIGGFLLQSADTTFKKVGIDLVDVDIFDVHDIEIGPDGYWTGDTSVGLRVRGRDAGTVRRYAFMADVPIQFSENPNNAIDIDHFHFHDGYTIANGNPNVLIDSGVNLTTITFDGYQAWVKGTHGLYWADTETTAVGVGLRLNNVRWEQSEDPTGHFVYLAHNYGLWQLLFSNCYTDPDANGFYLRKTRMVDFNEVIYPNAVGTGLDVDATSYPLSFRNCFFQTGCTLTTTGLTKISDSGQSTLAGTMSPEVIYDLPTYTTNAITMVNTTVSGRLTIPVVATASLPVAGSANDGLILIEDAGAGDVNLMIYARAERHRIDGGANV